MDRNLRILLDADALVALFYKNDSNHPRAQKIAREIQNKNISFFTSNLSICEAATVLSQITSQEEACDFIKRMKSGIDILYITQEVYEMGLDYFSSVKRKNTSAFDCINIAILRSYQLSAIFSFDEVYKKEGFKRIGIDS